MEANDTVDQLALADSRRGYLRRVGRWKTSELAVSSPEPGGPRLSLLSASKAKGSTVRR